MSGQSKLIASDVDSMNQVRKILSGEVPRSWKLIGGGAAALLGAYSIARIYWRESHRTAVRTEENSKLKKSSLFVRRLRNIFHIIMPGYMTKEFMYLVLLSALLISRTIFSVVIAEIVGGNVKYLVTKEWGAAMRGVFQFVLLSFPASLINSFIKYVSEMLSLKFRVRLSTHINARYITGTNFYAACNLNGMRDVDQRVTNDIQVFAQEIANLYSAVFKPILDIVLFTNQLRHITGWQGPTLMYSYFLLSAFLKKIVNEKARFGRLVAEESSLEGTHRTAHQRLITNSEEIAFYGGAQQERVLIENALQRLYRYSKHHRNVRALVGIFDQLLIKYWATIAGYFVMWVPIVFNVNSDKSVADLTRDYARISRYLENLSNAVGQLVLVINKLATISGHTKRVSELLEIVDDLITRPTVPFVRREESNKVRRVNPHLAQIEEWLAEWKQRADVERKARLMRRGDKVHSTRTLPNGGTYIEGDNIEFRHVDIVSPEGTTLAKDLNLTVEQQQNCMITGPNGAGKSSIFRVIGELWPLASGTLVKPSKEDFLFVPQKPYLVNGTLRDQIIYPHSHAQMKERGVGDDDLARLLALVDPANDILSTWRFDDEKDWFRAFSGGQKQRVAMARVFYHRPLYAILDECTSAVSSEVENKIYETCRLLGITIFTVSHRESLRIHHDYILRIEGVEGEWSMTKIAHLENSSGVSTTSQ